MYTYAIFIHNGFIKQSSDLLSPSHQLRIRQNTLQQIPILQVRPHIPFLLQPLQLLLPYPQVLKLISIICSEVLQRHTVLRVHPIPKRMGVQGHHSLHIPPQIVQILHILINLLLLIDDSIAVFLVKPVLDLILRVDVAEENIHVVLLPCRPDNHLEVGSEVVQELIQSFAFVDVEVGVELRKFMVVIVFPERSSEVPILVRGEGVEESVIDLSDHGEFVIGFGFQEFGFG